MKILNQFRIAAIMIFLFTLITGFIYPVMVTGIAQFLFPGKANGSMIIKDGKKLGSELIGQQFDDPKYFWGRLSATSPFAYNAGASSGSNYGPLNPAFLDIVNKRVHDLKTSDSLNKQPIPVDLVTASSSGLDPHISIAAAMYQIPRVARIRNVSEAQIRTLVDRYTEGRQFRFLGEPHVNVLKLNLALNEIQTTSGGK